MKKSKRALRRHHYYRLKNKRAGYYNQCVLVISEKKKAINVNTVPICSCAMCGNPLKYFKYLTKQERISEISFVEQCIDCGYY